MILELSVTTVQATGSWVPCFYTTPQLHNQQEQPALATSEDNQLEQEFLR